MAESKPAPNLTSASRRPVAFHLPRGAPPLVRRRAKSRRDWALAPCEADVSVGELDHDEPRRGAGLRARTIAPRGSIIVRPRQGLLAREPIALRCVQS